jgi:hypothetical protein
VEIYSPKKKVDSVGLEIQLFHPEWVEPPIVREVLGWVGSPDKIFQGIGGVAIPRFIYEQTSHDSETGAKAIGVANAEQRKQGRDESRYLAKSISTST